MFQRRKKDIQERREAAIRAVRQKTRGKEHEKIGIEYDPKL